MNIADDAAKLWPSFQWRYLLLLPVAAGIVHLIATFLAMADTRNSAYQRLSAALPINAMKVMAGVKPGQQPLPFMAADAQYAMCRFSSKQGPVDVNAVLPDRGWTLGVYYPDGSTAYFAAGSAGRPLAVALTLLPGDDRFLGLSPQALGKPPTAASQVSISIKSGLIVLRAPDRGSAYRLGDEAMLAKATCAAQPF
jgi:uncharacterized membrane protein